VHVLRDITLSMKDGECLALLGANGAGKTTLLRALSGLLVQREGEIKFCGRDISTLPSHDIVRAGIAHVAEGKHLFAPLSVSENLELGALTVRAADQKGRISDARDLVYQLFPRLKDRLKQPAGTLSGGEQQMLSIARALMALPKLLLLDEPSAGLAPILIEQMFDALSSLKKIGLAIIIAEQNVELGLQYADHGAVMHLGRIAMIAPKAELQGNSNLAHLYLGGN
jgi:branched-chain amino acid transport system ATP-binding protein